MKDLAHHMKKLNRKVIRSVHRNDLAEEIYENSIPKEPQKRAISSAPSMKRGKKEASSKRKNPPVFDRGDHFKGNRLKKSRKKTPPL